MVSWLLARSDYSSLDLDLTPVLPDRHLYVYALSYFCDFCYYESGLVLIQIIFIPHCI